MWRKTRNHSPRTVRPEVLIAGAALLLSVTTVLAAAWFAIRGSVVTAVPPDSVFFYRDAGRGAVLTAGVDTSLVNSASGNYGDVVTRITMEVDTTGNIDPAFGYQVLITPVFTETAERQQTECPVTARCVRNGRFLAIEESRRTLDVPGGASQSEYVGFTLEKGNCATPGACEAFVDFASAAAALDGMETLTLRFRYRLHSDGEKVAVCKLNLRSPGVGPHVPWLAQRLETAGYALIPCER